MRRREFLKRAGAALAATLAGASAAPELLALAERRKTYFLPLRHSWTQADLDRIAAAQPMGEPYFAEFDCRGMSAEQLYERLKYAARRGTADIVCSNQVREKILGSYRVPNFQGCDYSSLEPRFLVGMAEKGHIHKVHHIRNQKDFIRVFGTNYSRTAVRLQQEAMARSLAAGRPYWTSVQREHAEMVRGATRMILSTPKGHRVEWEYWGEDNKMHPLQTSEVGP
jgi:hypothetical protein